MKLHKILAGAMFAFVTATATIAATPTQTIAVEGLVAPQTPGGDLTITIGGIEEDVSTTAACNGAASTEFYSDNHPDVEFTLESDGVTATIDGFTADLNCLPLNVALFVQESLLDYVTELNEFPSDIIEAIDLADDDIANFTVHELAVTPSSVKTLDGERFNYCYTPVSPRWSEGNLVQAYVRDERQDGTDQIVWVHLADGTRIFVVVNNFEDEISKISIGKCGNGSAAVVTNSVVVAPQQPPVVASSQVCIWLNTDVNQTITMHPGRALSGRVLHQASASAMSWSSVGGGRYNGQYCYDVNAVPTSAYASTGVTLCTPGGQSGENLFLPAADLRYIRDQGGLGQGDMGVMGY